jgi:hypothetical protein
MKLEASSETMATLEAVNILRAFERDVTGVAERILLSAIYHLEATLRHALTNGGK